VLTRYPDTISIDALEENKKNLLEFDIQISTHETSLKIAHT